MVEVSAILLGAGESKRMGVDKLSLTWGRKTVLEHCLKTLLQSKVKEVIVVVNDRMKRLVDHAKDQKVHPERSFFTPPSKVGFGDAERVKIVNNRYYKRGMSTSVRRGLHAIDPRSHGILIALGDQPLIKTRTINALIHAFVQRKGTIVVPSFRGKQGHPVIFHCRYLKELLKLKGDVGGRSIIERHPGEVRLVRVKSEGVTKDMDTWEDYNPPDAIPPPLPADRQAQVGREKGRGKK
jgi:molybdenum cofactor cytidylyltransferase